MAQVSASQSVNFHNTGTWYGFVEEASGSRIIVSDGQSKSIYQGNFFYDVYDQPHGQLTGYQEQYLGRTVVTASGFAVDAFTAFSIIQSGDSYSLLTLVLQGADTINGSDFSDTVDGFQGNDLLSGGGGNDALWGGEGYDHINGGVGFDTAFFMFDSSEYVVTKFGGNVAVSSFGSELGVDMLVGVERLEFADLAREVPEQDFAALEYIASHTDLITAFGGNADAGFSHFVYSGVYEVRQTTFDALEYIASHSDLIRAFGADAEAGAMHFIHTGVNEGRQATFDALEYIASHDDLIRAFGADAEAGAMHFIHTGVNEGRTAEGFDVEQYLANYADLQVAFGNDIDAATEHYITNGFGEGRTDDAVPSADWFVF